MSQESGGTCCCCQPRSNNKVVPVLTGNDIYRTIEVRPSRYICVHYFNPHPRDDKFQKQMEEVIEKSHSEKICKSVLEYKKIKYEKKDVLDMKDQESKNGQVNGNSVPSGNSVDGTRSRGLQVSDEPSGAEDHPPVLSPSELTMLSLKSNTENSSSPQNLFVPLPDCTSKIKYPNQTIFLVHGVGGSLDIWSGQTKYFADLGYEVIVPEWIGHGSCPGSSDPRDFFFNEIAEDLLLVFDLHCKKSNIIIGHSYGACFAAVLARRRPRLVQSLVMISGGAPTPLAPQSGLFKAPTCVLACLSPLLRYCLMQRAFYKKSGHTEDQKKAFGVSASVIQHTMNGQIWPEGDSEYHHGISCPTLLIHGSEDQLISVEDEIQMQEAIFGSQLQVIEEASHMVMMEKPSVVNAYIKQLISGTSLQQMQDPLASGKDLGSLDSVESQSHILPLQKDQGQYPNKLLLKVDTQASPRKSARSIPSRIFSAKKRS